MKLYISISTFSLILFISCNSRNTRVESYIESQPSFFDLRHGDPTKNSWIRSPQNLLMVHETFKKIGYRNLIDINFMDENPFIGKGVYINKSLRQILDSLQITYKLATVKQKYYREFWQRRKAEHNDSIVYVIVKEINASFKNVIAPAFNNDLVNDTLFNLAFVEFRRDRLNPVVAADNFFRLQKFGFHQSAYNLLYRTTEYSNVYLNKDSLKQTLTISKDLIYPWFVDNEGP
jgi:hypothetical protein